MCFWTKDKKTNSNHLIYPFPLSKWGRTLSHIKCLVSSCPKELTNCLQNLRGEKETKDSLLACASNRWKRYQVLSAKNPLTALLAAPSKLPYLLLTKPHREWDANQSPHHREHPFPKGLLVATPLPPYDFRWERWSSSLFLSIGKGGNKHPSVSSQMNSL